MTISARNRARVTLPAPPVADPLLALVPEALEVRDLAGFQRTTWDALDRKLACVYAELEELTAALHDGARAQVADELADVALYLLTILGDLCAGDVTQRGVGRLRGSPHAEPEVLVAPVRRYVHRAWRYWRGGTEQRDATLALELALLETRRLALVLEVSLPDACWAKLQRNRARGERHGGKRAET